MSKLIENIQNEYKQNKEKYDLFAKKSMEVIEPFVQLWTKGVLIQKTLNPYDFTWHKNTKNKKQTFTYILEMGQLRDVQHVFPGTLCGPKMLNIAGLDKNDETFWLFDCGVFKKNNYPINEDKLYFDHYNVLLNSIKNLIDGYYYNNEIKRMPWAIKIAGIYNYNNNGKEVLFVGKQEILSKLSSELNITETNHLLTSHRIMQLFLSKIKLSNTRKNDVFIISHIIWNLFKSIDPKNDSTFNGKEKKDEELFFEHNNSREKLFNEVYDSKKHKGLFDSILKFIYKTNNHFIKTKDFKSILQKELNLSDKIIEYWYSFLDNSGSVFDHKIRSKRTELSRKKGYLISKDHTKGPYKASQKLLNESLEKEKEIIDLFIEETSKKINSIAFSNESKKVTGSFVQKLKQQVINEFDQKVKQKELLIKAQERNNLKETQAAVIQDYHNEFVNNLKKEFNNQKVNSIEESQYKNSYCDAAHIVSKERCRELEQYNWIEDPNNGLFLEPNIHRLFDKEEEKIYVNDKWELVNKDNIVIGTIKKEYQNDKRRCFLNKREI